MLDRLFRGVPTTALPAVLTVAERRVLQLVATGLSNAEVAARLTVSQSTVRKHLEHSYRKLGATNRVTAVRRFEGWLAEEPERAARVASAEPA